MEGQRLKKSIKKPSKASKHSPSTSKKRDNLLNPSYITIHEEVDSIF